MATAPDIDVEVIYALPQEQVLLKVRVAAGTTAAQAISACGVLARYPEIDPARMTIGVFSKIVPPDTPLNAGDRVEIYRPLTVDPKEARRQRGGKR
jgi:uncharacterized protein